VPESANGRTARQRPWVGNVYRSSDGNGLGYHYALHIVEGTDSNRRLYSYFHGEYAADIVRSGYMLHTLDAPTRRALVARFHGWVARKIMA